MSTLAQGGHQRAGYDADVAGFARALREDAGFDPNGKQVAVLGAGGAARAIALVLIEGGASLIYVTGRSPRRIDKLVGDLRGFTSPGITITWSYWLAGTFLRVMPDVDLLVNCTPVGTYKSETAGTMAISAKKGGRGSSIKACLTPATSPRTASRLGSNP